jgi:hypothetical protein
MGEHKRPKDVRDMAERLSKGLTDEGKIIEGGWLGYRALVIPKDASPVHIDECRKAFFCGADHLFASIMTILDPGAEPTDKDLERMSLIQQELEAFRMVVTADHKPGRA